MWGVQEDGNATIMGGGWRELCGIYMGASAGSGTCAGIFRLVSMDDGLMCTGMYKANMFFL